MKITIVERQLDVYILKYSKIGIIKFKEEMGCTNSSID